MNENIHAQINESFNNTMVEYSKDLLLHKVFELQVEKTPDKIAVIYNDETITYSQLNQKSNQLAKKLISLGVEKESIVAVCIDRSIEMIIGIMSILKAGGAYMPINVEDGPERIKYMIENCNAKIVLTSNDYEKNFSSKLEIVNLNDKGIYIGDSKNVVVDLNSNNLAYVIYTSGSTGNPKGVMIEHYSVVNNLFWMLNKYEVENDDVILQKTPYTFDVSIWELFIWSFVGATVCMLKQGDEKKVELLVNTIEKRNITLIHFVPSMLNIFIDFIEHRKLVSNISCVKKVFASGEAINSVLVNKFNKIICDRSKTELHNLYGPTEATVHVTFFNCTKYHSDIIPIGKPINNTRMYVLKKDKTLCDIGEEGEIFIAGDCVGRGYINAPNLTNENFTMDPFIKNSRMYKTGDFGKWNSEGEIEYLGRIDNQIKIRGNRIELGEIEVHLLSLKNISNASIQINEDNDGNKLIYAFYVSEKEINAEDIKIELKKYLPEYMLPSRLFQVDSIPLTNNGKVDRKKLMECTIDKSKGPRNKKSSEKSKFELKVIETLLKFGELSILPDEIGLDSKLVDLNLNSISFIKMVVALESEFDFEFEDNFLDLNKFPKINNLLEYIEKASTMEPA